VKSQERRDEDAVVIGTAMLWLAAVAVVVWVPFAVISSVTGLEDGPLIYICWDCCTDR
jgi:hypothetical protein